MAYAYPIVIDVADRSVVIVGGGGVALRKAKGLLAARARHVTCVAPQIDPAMPGEVVRILESFQPHHLDGAQLAFAATDNPQVNESVVAEARRRGIWVNRADTSAEAAGDFTLPAQFQQSHVIVSVSAGGSPALAAVIRDDLAAKLNPAHLAMAEFLQTLRPKLLGASGVDAATRTRIFRQLCQPAALALLTEQGPEGLLRWLKTQYPAFRG